MSDAKKTSVFSFTKPAILNYPHLLTPKPPHPKEKDKAPKFEADFVFAADHPDLAAIRKAIAEVARAENPSIDLATLKGRTCLKSGTEIADATKAKKGINYSGAQDWLKGQAVLKARTGLKFPPTLGVWDTGKNIQSLDRGKVASSILTLADEDLKNRYSSLFFSGAEIGAEVVFFWYPGFGGGVGAYLQKVITTGMGTRRASGRSMSEAFSGFAGNVTTEDPTGGEVDDELPF